MVEGYSGQNKQTNKKQVKILALDMSLDQQEISVAKAGERQSELK